MVIVILHFDVFPGQELHFEEVWRQAAALQAEQRGLLSSRLLRSLQTTSHYTSYSVWDSETDIAFSGQNAAYQELVRKFPLVAPPQQHKCVLRYEVTAGGEVEAK